MTELSNAMGGPNDRTWVIGVASGVTMASQNHFPKTRPQDAPLPGNRTNATTTTNSTARAIDVTANGHRRLELCSRLILAWLLTCTASPTRSHPASQPT